MRMRALLHPRRDPMTTRWTALCAPRGAVLALAFFAPACVAQYAVSRAPDARSLLLTLRLPSGSAVPVKLAVRGDAWGLTPQVSDVRCNRKALKQDAQRNWVAPAGCRTVTWRIVPDSVPTEGADASKQRTLLLGPAPWFVLAEPTGLLRPHNVSVGGTLSVAKGLGQVTMHRVPSVDRAPEFYAIGDIKPSLRRLGPLQVRYFSDRPDRTEALGLEARHAAVLAYLLRVVPLPGASTAAGDKLLVFWLGIAEGRGEAGGSAGGRSFVANYITGSRKHNDSNIARTMVVMAHEQFHQLVDIVRGDLALLPFETWLNESLAHYYGLKALLAVDSSAAARGLWKKYVNAQRPVEYGLLECDRRHESGDATVYDRFYTQGATLWHLLDGAIAKATGGHKTLDDFVNELLRQPQGENGQLPAAFVHRLRQLGGTEIDDILTKYVGQ